MSNLVDELADELTDELTDELNDELNIIPASDLIIPLPITRPNLTQVVPQSTSKPTPQPIQPPRTPNVRGLPRVVPTVQANNLPQNSLPRPAIPTTRTGSRVPHRVVNGSSIGSSITPITQANQIEPTNVNVPVTPLVIPQVSLISTQVTPISTGTVPQALSPLASSLVSSLVSSQTSTQISTQMSVPTMTTSQIPTQASIPTVIQSPPTNPILTGETSQSSTQATSTQATSTQATSTQAEPLFPYTPPVSQTNQSSPTTQTNQTTQSSSQIQSQSQALMPVQALTDDKFSNMFSNIPNYEAMSPDQQIFHYTDFDSKYAVIRPLLPGRNIPTPEQIRSTPLRHIHIQYNVHLRAYEIAKQAQDYKDRLKMTWAGFEVAAISFFNINIKDYVRMQIQSLNDYELIFQQMSERDYQEAQKAKLAAAVSGVPIEPESLESQLLKAAAKNTMLFIVTKYLADATGMSVPGVQNILGTIYRVVNDMNTTPATAGTPQITQAGQTATNVPNQSGGFGSILSSLMSSGALGALGSALPGLISAFTGNNSQNTIQGTQSGVPAAQTQTIARPAIFDD